MAPNTEMPQGSQEHWLSSLISRPAARGPWGIGPEPPVTQVGKMRPRAEDGLTCITAGVGGRAGASFVPSLSVLKRPETPA